MAEEHKQKIVDYFKKNLAKGYTPESLKWALVKQGYSRSIVDIALELARKEPSEKAPVLKEKPKIDYAIIDEHDKPIIIKKPWWKKLLGL